MRKLTKVLSAVLLVSLIVSVFAGFSIFVADAAEALPTGVRELYNMDSKSSIIVNESKDSTGAKETIKIQKITQENGDVYWTQTQRNTATDGNGNWWSAWSSSTPVVVKGTGTAGALDENKNTDFLVFDMDLSTDSTFVGALYANLRQRSAGATANNKGGSSTGGDSYTFRINFNGSEVSSITNGASKNVANNQWYTGEKWTHVTIVIDTSSDDSANWRTLAYINGHYAGTVGKINSNTRTIWFNRFQLLNTELGSTQSINYANYTVRQFTPEYTGNIGEMLAKEDVLLSDIPGLAYCMENAPQKAKVAELTRGGETTAVYDFDELDASLQDGDSVKLFTEMNRKIIVPANATISWDLNGFKMADPLVFDYSGYDWIVRDRQGNLVTDADGNVIGAGVQEYDEEAEISSEGNKTVLADNLYSVLAIREEWTLVTILGERVVSNSNKYNVPASIVFDLNGNTFVQDANSDKLFVISDRESVVIKNGSYEYDHDGDAFSMPNQVRGALFLFKNLTSLDVSQGDKDGVFFDQRAGHVVFKDCDYINVGSLCLTNLKGGYIMSHASLTIDGCPNVVGNSDTLIKSSNVISGGYTYGTFDLGVTIKDSTLTNSNRTGKIIVVQANGNTKLNSSLTGPGVTGGDTNNNRYDIEIINSKLVPNGSESVIQVSVGTVSNSSYDLDGDGAKDKVYPETFTFDIDMYVKDSEINAANLIRQVDFNESSLPDTTQFIYDVDVDIEGDTKLLTPAGVVRKDGAGGTASLSVGDGAKLANDKLFAYADYTGALTLGNGESILVNTAAEEGYAYIVLSDYATYTYQLGNQEPVEFYWNKGEDELVDPARVVTLASDDLGTYTWGEKEGNAFKTVLNKAFSVGAKSNLTLVEDFQFNLYIPAEKIAAYGEYITVTDKNGTALVGETVEIDGVQYIKYKVKNIAPAEAEAGAMSVNIAFAGAYGDQFAASYDLTVLDYTEKVIAGGNADEIAFIEAILNYIAAAYTIAGNDSTNVDALISEDAEFATEIDGEAKLESAAGIEVALNYGTDLNWVIKATEAMTVTVEYTYDGNAATVTKELAAGESFMLSFKAYDMVNSIKVNGAEVNLKGYYNGLTDENAKAMVIAIYNYVKAAAEYKV